MNIAIATNMFAYDCPNPLEPKNTAAGHIHLCTCDELKEAAEVIKMFHEELDIDRSDDEKYLSRTKEFIKGGHLFFWKDSFNQTVACCSYTPNGDLASVNSVYTLPTHRRKHYAQNLVYQVTKIIKSTGAMSMLYTDADYVAFNACYEKIGYVLRGKLCTIGV